jgi:hypothetical protein
MSMPCAKQLDRGIAALTETETAQKGLAKEVD